jgi:hypothetical protein
MFVLNTKISSAKNKAKINNGNSVRILQVKTFVPIKFTEKSKEKKKKKRKKKKTCP